jgi:hypothetical protein
VSPPTPDGGPDGAPASHWRNAVFQPETLLRALGLFYLLGGAVVGFGGLMVRSVLDPLVDGDEGVSSGAAYALTAAQVGLLALSLVTGAGLRRLRPWAYFPAIGLSLLSLAAPPVGTLMGAFGLFALLRPAGRAALGRPVHK